MPHGTSLNLLLRFVSVLGPSSCALGQTLRLKLIAVYYAPFFLIPLRLLTFSVFRTYEKSSTVSLVEIKDTSEKVEDTEKPKSGETN